MKRFLVVVAVFMMVSFAYGQTGDSAGMTLADVDKILETKTVENCEKAIEGYKALLKTDPDNHEILYKLADAYIYVIDIKTNTLMEEKDEYKPLLKKYGKLANDYAAKACKLKADSKEAIAANLISYGYYSASFGIFKAIFKGAAGKYKDLARRLNELDENYRGGLGYRSLGKLYHVAPWPVGSKKKALKNFLKSIEIDNSVLYSHYYAGVIYLAQRKYALAEKEFQFVVDNEPAPNETHFFKAYKDSAQEYLDQFKKYKGK
jgi:tetratricopeptide (TPR) repeat protein